MRFHYVQIESIPSVEQSSSSLYYTFKSSRFGTEHNTRYVYSPPPPATSTDASVGNAEPLTIIFIHGFGGNADQVSLYMISDNHRYYQYVCL